MNAVASKRVFLLLLVFGVMWISFPSACPSDSCNATTIGTDLSQTEDYVGCFLGIAAGQTFTASDSLIQSIAVWRMQPPSTPDQLMKLWVTHVDSTGWPVFWEVIQEGPTLIVPGDPILRDPVKVTYAFDPPLALPGRGMFAFFVQDPCAFPVNFHYNLSGNIYPDGRFWRTPRTNFQGCGLDSPFYDTDRELNADLIFEIEFCSEATTPTVPHSWGRIKVIYR